MSDWYDRWCVRLAVVAALAWPVVLPLLLAAKPFVRAWFGVHVDFGLTP